MEKFELGSDDWYRVIPVEGPLAGEILTVRHYVEVVVRESVDGPCRCFNGAAYFAVPPGVYAGNDYPEMIVTVNRGTFIAILRIPGGGDHACRVVCDNQRDLHHGAFA